MIQSLKFLFNLVLIILCTQFVFADDNGNQTSEVFISPAEEATQVKADNYFSEKVIQTKLAELKANDTPVTTRSAPDWEDDPGAYVYIATMTAAISNGGAQLSDTDDILAAFDDAGNVRGTSFALDVGFGPYEGTVVHEISLRSNDEGDHMTFKFYDASEDAVLDVFEDYIFIINDIIGSMVAPHALSAGAPDLGCDECVDDDAALAPVGGCTACT